jgi:glycerate 2-kinase
LTRRFDDQSAKTLLRDMFDAAIASADPRVVLAGHLPEKPKGRCVVVGAGKASAAMAAALESAWPDVAMSGVVVTRYGHAVPTTRIKIIEAAHPVPDEKSLQASVEVMAAVNGLGADDLVIALMSGGGSSLLVSPAGQMTLADKQEVNRTLLHSGASIYEMNAVRRRLSNIKGGRLAQAAAPARVVTLVISDVPGDDPSIIASGPTVPEPLSIEDVIEIVARYNLKLPATAIAALDNAGDETFKPVASTDVRMIASPSMALAAAANVTIKHGLTSLILGDALEGEAREVGKVMAGIALSSKIKGLPVKGPVVILSGGETTVTIEKGKAGRGGRNTEFLLSLAIALHGADDIWALAGDTDGIDGTEDAAGAVITPDSLYHGLEQKLDARDFLIAHDSYSYFEAIRTLIKTGPTLTNVNDFRAILIGSDLPIQQ